MLNKYKSMAQNRAEPKVTIMVSLNVCILLHRLLFDETIIINEAQVPPTDLLCEVVAGEMVTWKDFIMLPFLIIMQH